MFVILYVMHSFALASPLFHFDHFLYPSSSSSTSGGDVARAKMYFRSSFESSRFISASLNVGQFSSPLSLKLAGNIREPLPSAMSESELDASLSDDDGDEGDGGGGGVFGDTGNCKVSLGITG